MGRRRFRGRAGGGRGRGASAFAPARSGGRTIAWEALSVSVDVDSVQNQFPTVAFSDVDRRIRFVTLIPANVLRGPVTLERVRGSISAWGSSDMLTVFDQWSTTVSMQLVPLRDGAIEAVSVLNDQNSGDLESNRIIWRHNYVPLVASPLVGPAAAAMTSLGGGEIDIKSKRRFDRATWALILVCNTNVANLATVFFSLDLRALFRTSDGI